MDQQLLNDIIQWDIKNWSKLIDLWTPVIKNNKLKKALALGERDGGLSLWLALNNKTVSCTDFKLNSLDPLPLHIKHKVEDRIKYREEDATKLSYESNSFDIVIFKSMLGAIETPEKQKKAIREAFRVLKPGGYLLFAENLKATKIHQYARKRFIPWGENWNYPTMKDLEKSCNKFKSFNYETAGFISLFGRNEAQRYYLGNLDKAFKYITPKKWHYILFGMAQK